jgi:UDP:flavonoid glycosyltransferase YjiC (YdhE family)
MTRFAFVTWDGGGNVTPAVGMAQELVSRGHDVVFIGYEVQRKRFEGKGPFIFEMTPQRGVEREKGFEPSTLTLARYRSNSVFGRGRKRPLGGWC